MVVEGVVWHQVGSYSVLEGVDQVHDATRIQEKWS